MLINFNYYSSAVNFKNKENKMFIFMKMDLMMAYPEFSFSKSCQDSSRGHESLACMHHCPVINCDDITLVPLERNSMLFLKLHATGKL
jgi:hypothetical protein